MKVAQFFLLALSLFSLSALAEKSEAELKKSFREAIRRPETVNQGDWWRAQGPQTPQIIMAEYKGTKSIYTKVKWVEVLGNFNDPKVVDFLKTETGATHSKVVRYACIRSLSRAQGTESEDFIASLLTHADPQTRLEAAQALKRLQDPKAEKLVEDYLPTEKTTWVVERLKSAENTAQNRAGKIVIKR